MTARSFPNAPKWLSSQNACAGCAYDLAGLPDDGVCPECGLHYSTNTLILIATKPTIRTAQTRTPLANLRRFAVILYIVLIVFFLQGAFILLFTAGVVVTIATVVVFLAIGVALFMTSKPAERHGRCELRISPQGLTITPLERKKRDTPAQPEFHNWPDEPLILHIKRAGQWWAKLIIKPIRGRPILVAGVGIPQEHHQAVRDYIGACINKEPTPKPPPPALPWLRRNEQAAARITERPPSTVHASKPTSAGQHHPD